LLVIALVSDIKYAHVFSCIVASMIRSIFTIKLVRTSHPSGLRLIIDNNEFQISVQTFCTSLVAT